MTTADPRSIRTALRSALTSAMKQRDREATAVYRGALSAIDNAEAMPVGSGRRERAIEGSAVGVGSTDVPRWELTEQDMMAIVVSDARERSAAAGVLETVDPARAHQLNRGADLLLTLARASDGHRAAPSGTERHRAAPNAPSGTERH